MLEAGLGRGKLMDTDTGKVLRMFLPGVGGSQAKFDKSMDAFLEAADFGLRNDQNLLAKLIAGSQAQANSGAVQAGAQTEYGASQKAVGSLATALADIGGDLLADRLAKPTIEVQSPASQGDGAVPFNFIAELKKQRAAQPGDF